jgi:hypothetical protein
MAKIEVTIDEILDLYTRYFEAENIPVRNIVSVDEKTAKGEIKIPSLSIDIPVTLTFDSFLKPNVIFKVLSKSNILNKILPVSDHFIKKYSNNILTIKMPYLILDTEAMIEKYSHAVQILDVQHDGEKFIMDIGIKNL